MEKEGRTVWMVQHTHTERERESREGLDIARSVMLVLALVLWFATSEAAMACCSNSSSSNSSPSSSLSYSSWRWSLFMCIVCRWASASPPSASKDSSSALWTAKAEHGAVHWMVVVVQWIVLFCFVFTCVLCVELALFSFSLPFVIFVDPSIYAHLHLCNSTAHFSLALMPDRHSFKTKRQLC